MPPNSKDKEPPYCKKFKCEEDAAHKGKCKKADCKPKLSPFQEMLSALKGSFPFPAFIRSWGPGRTDALKQYLPGLAIYGAGSLLALIYFSEWKTVLKYMPYYRGKYTDLWEKKEKVVKASTNEPEKVEEKEVGGKQGDDTEDVVEDADET